MEKGELINLHVDKGTKPLILDERTTKFTVSKIDSSQLVAEVSKILTIDGNNFILDRKTNALFCFGPDGIFKWTYGKPGKGPEEHDALTDFSVRRDTVYLFDKLNKILKLDTLGRFIKAQKLTIGGQWFYADLFFVNKQGEYVFYNNDMADSHEFAYKFLTAPPTLKKINDVYMKKTNKEGDRRWAAGFYPVQTMTNNSGFFYTEPLNDTIYKYVDTTFIRKYAVDFGKYTLSKSYLNQNRHELSDFWKTKFGSNITSIFETDSLLTFRTTIAGQLYYHFFRKATHEVQNFSVVLLKSGDFYASMQFIGGAENKLYFLIEPDLLMNAYKYIKKGKYNKISDTEYRRILTKTSPLFAKLLDGTNIYSNQLIVSVNISTKDLFKSNKL